MQPLQKFQELFILFVDAQYFAASLARKSTAIPLPASSACDSSSQRNAVRAGPLIAEALQEQSFHFRRDGMFHSLRLVVSLRPGHPITSVSSISAS